jgi:hypothetical protein
MLRGGLVLWERQAMGGHIRFIPGDIGRDNLRNHANTDGDNTVKWAVLTLMIFGAVYSFLGGLQADVAYSGEMSDKMKKR